MIDDEQVVRSKPKYDLESRTTEFAKRVVRMCSDIVKDTINREIISQLVRSSGSVGANYREANEALGKKDFAYRIRISRKEAKESSHWLEILAEACPHLRKEIDVLIDESTQLVKILSSIAEKVAKNV